MKLVAFSVRNYRSIKEAYKLTLGNYTVLVGPNNEGKSNIVKAIALSLSVLTRSRPLSRTRRAPSRYYRSEFRFDYRWERDFPLSLQEKKPNGRSEFTLEFEFTDAELNDFKTKVGCNLSTNLKVKFGFAEEDVSMEILMNGRGKKALNKKRSEIGTFLRERISSQYIPALRPSERALKIVESLIEAELASLEATKEYEDVIAKITELQKPILDEIGQKICATVSSFVPGVTEFDITNAHVSRALRTSFKINVDDGAKTELASKGDGIISLTTMALMKHISEDRIEDESLILAIEEPESHLHPEAIHGLRQVLKEISADQQVILTTHSPILVEREHIGQNVLVRDGRATKAKQIGDIRDALGIQMADNLLGAFVVLLVEGEEDLDLLNAWLQLLSPKIKSAINKRLLVIDHLGGATNLGYKALFYKQNVCNIHAFMDNDSDGRKATEKALERGIIEAADYNLTACQGMQDAELEDLLVVSSYSPKVIEKFGVDLAQPRFRGTSMKWSGRAEKVFKLSGKIWNKSVKMQLKRTVIDEAVAAGLGSLNPHHKPLVEALVSTLEVKLEARLG